MSRKIIIIDKGEVVQTIDEDKAALENGKIIEKKETLPESGTNFTMLGEPYSTGEEFSEAGEVEESSSKEETLANEETSLIYERPVEAEKEQTLKPKSEKKSSRILTLALTILLVFTTAFGGAYGGYQFALSQNKINLTSGQEITINPSDDITTTEVVAAKVIPSVVGISTRSVIEAARDYEHFFYGRRAQEVEGVGTGFIIDESGYILTNSHVVSNGEVDTLTVLLSDSREVSGTVLWNDIRLDLAIVKIEADYLTVAELGDSDSMKIGAYAVAVGNPLGLNFKSSVSQGVVSGLNRTIVASDGSAENAVLMEGLMQVDAAINHGNSGGPLVNSKGQVVGINTAKNASGEGMGFAIPINTAKPVIDRIKESGTFSNVYIGAEIHTLGDLLEKNKHLNFGTKTGAYVRRVKNNSPAERAGIKAEDIIVKVDGNEVKTRSDVLTALLKYKEGDIVEITLMRDGKPLEVEVSLAGTF